MKPRIYLCRNKNTSIRLKSSSGGIFYELAAWAINQKGVVFGAAFNKDWGVDIIKIEKIDDIEKLMGSKYTLANINNTYQEAKKELEKGKVVLFSATPCQIAGLRQYLKNDYDKLFCLEVCCHGAVPQHIWRDYLKTLKRDNAHITKISFRDKTYGWRKFSFRVDYSDKTTFIEPHPKNSYMQLFLKSHYLLPSCYHCQFKDKNSRADMAIGDFWGRHGIRYKKFNDNLGTSIVSVNNEKGATLLNGISEKIEQMKVSKHRVLRYNGAWNSEIKTKRENYDPVLLQNRIKDIVIITLPLRANMGGILQAYALQSFLKQEGFNVTFAQSKYPDTLKFVYDNISIKWMKHRFNRFRDIKQNEFDAIVVGSDQVWRRYYVYGNIGGYFLNFAKKWNIRKVAYAASFGKDTWDYIKLRTHFIKKSLSKFDRVSVREESAMNLCKQYLGVSSTVTVDPTLLLDNKFYSDVCKNIPHKNGFFAYILDSSDNTNDALVRISEQTITPIYPHNKNSVEDWLACFRDAKFIITDSYHGCIFSIIFNKPFVCIANTKRGNARFSHLIKTYGIQNRIFGNFSSIDYSMLNVKPNLLPKVEILRKESINYLKESLATPLVIKTKELLK